MRAFCISLLLATLASLSGCGGGTVGGPGADGSNDKSATGLAPPEDTFAIAVPLLATQVKQGESKTVTLTLNRGKNFDEDVTLSFDKLPRGVTVEPASPQIRASETAAKITLTAAPDASLGEFTINVVGHPTQGKDAANKLTVKVAEKENAAKTDAKDLR